MNNPTQTTTKNSLTYTSIKWNSDMKSGSVLIKSGDENRSSWRKFKVIDGVMIVKYKKHQFSIDTENKLIVGLGQLDGSVFMVKRRVIKSRWTTLQQQTINNGMTLVVEGIDYMAKEGHKVCKCCNDTLELDKFAKKSVTKDKLQPKCRQCDSNGKKYRKLDKVA